MHAHTASLLSELVLSFHKYLLSLSCESGTVLGAGDTVVKKDQVCPHEKHSPAMRLVLVQQLENVEKKSVPP